MCKPSIDHHAQDLSASVGPAPSPKMKACRGFFARIVIGACAVPLLALTPQMIRGRPVTSFVYVPSSKMTVSPGFRRFAELSTLPHDFNGAVSLVPAAESDPVGDR